MTDDQTRRVAAGHAEHERAARRTQGVTFRNNFVSFSLCCPSRATWLTGQYAHNHGVRGNQRRGGGYGKLDAARRQPLPVWLQSAGYYTAHIGKYLNGYGDDLA